MDPPALRGGPAPEPVDVMVVGAGPTGLALALQAVEHGARVRVLERRLDIVRPSRAMIVHPRTLEVLRPLGITQELLDHALPSTSVQVHLGARSLTVRLDTFRLEGSPFPHPVLIRQSDVEDVLVRALARRGIGVERGIELVNFVPGADLVRVLLRGAPDSVGSCRYLVGADGVGSTVRRLAGIGWDGGTYRSEVVLADVELRGAVQPNPRLVPTAAGLVFLFPLGEQARWRLLATRRATPSGAEPGQFGPPLPADELRPVLAALGDSLEVSSVAWSSRIRLPHRLARRFRRGRVFLAGDAAHAHSPAGGQGMNTGLQDAANLGWKLAYASRSDAADCSLLASYEIERRPVAQRVRALTRALFWAEAGTGPIPALLRSRLVPSAAGILERMLLHRWPGSMAIWLLAQFWVRYRSSPLSLDRRRFRYGHPTPGDRVPDEEVVAHGRSLRLHELLATPGVHVLLDQDAAREAQALAGPNVHVHRLANQRGQGVRAIRPDGYLGYRAASVDATSLGGWLDVITGGDSRRQDPRGPGTGLNRSTVP